MHLLVHLSGELPLLQVGRVREDTRDRVVRHHSVRAQAERQVELKNQEIALENSKEVILEVAKKYKKLTGRGFGLFEEYRTKDADYIMLIMGSAAGTAKQAVDEMREKGKKVGVLKLRVFRPFPADEIAQALKNCKAVAIMDRCESYNGNGGPLGSEVPAALFKNKVMIEAVNYIYGLAGRDFTISDVAGIFNELEDMVVNGKEVEQYQYIRLR